MRRVLLILTILLLRSVAATGQEIHPPPDGLLVVETNAPDAVVLIDAEIVGVASDSPFLLPAGPRQIVLVEATENGWAPRRVSGSVIVAADQTVTVHLNLPFRYRIDSMPPNAEIVLRLGGSEEVLGIAPLTVDRPEAMVGMLVARRAGFMPAEVPPGDSLFNHHTLMMQPLEAGAELDAVTSWIPPRKPRRWIDYTAAGVALAAASVAIYYKFEADDLDDRYRSPGSLERGDPLLKQEAERLDLYSLGALGIMQVGITVLAVRFVLR